MLPKISKILFVTSLLALSGCASLTPQPEDVSAQASRQGPKQKVFYAPYDQVWRAAQLAMAKYYMSVNNMDTGVLETDFIKGADGWKAPDATKDPSSGVRYKITLRLVKGKSGSRPSVRAAVSKKLEIQRDFFSDSETLNSDGLEEMIILYRIDRELTIENALKRAQKT
jgi:hypothetical protein